MTELTEAWEQVAAAWAEQAEAGQSARVVRGAAWRPEWLEQSGEQERVGDGAAARERTWRKMRGINRFLGCSAGGVGVGRVQVETRRPAVEALQ